MTKTKTAAIGDRLAFLIAKMKAPRLLERLVQTAARAREESWPYEQFVEALLEAEVFARDASGARLYGMSAGRSGSSGLTTCRSGLRRRHARRRDGMLLRGL
jgi:hypothetical protein